MRTSAGFYLHCLIIILGMLAVPSAFASPALEFRLKLEGNLFFPSRLEIPANKKIRLIIINLDSTPEEFDSFDLNREKVIYPQRQAVIYVGPLKPGEYEFFGEYNPNTARGVLIATEPPSGGPDAD
jgi:hypothetical protein